MGKIIAISTKDIKLRFTGFAEWLFFLILPLVFTLLLSGVAFGDSAEADNRITVAVVDNDQSELSANMLAQLSKSESVKPQLMELAAAEQDFKDRDASAIVIIPAGAEASLQAGQPTQLEFRLSPSGNNGIAAQQEVQKVIGQISRTLAVAQVSVNAADALQPFNNDPEKLAYLDTSRAAAQAEFDAAPVRVVITTPDVSPVAERNQAAQASAGQLIIWVFIPLLGTSELMAYERFNGTLRRLVTTPTRRGTFLLGTISGQMAIALVQMAILVGVGVFLLKVPWGDNPVALVVTLIAFGLSAVAMGTMLGTFTKTPAQANGVSIALGMVMGLLGGCMWPLELFPPGVQTAVQVLPTTWAMQAMTKLTALGGGLPDILPNVAVLLGFALVFFVIGVWRFRYE